MYDYCVDDPVSKRDPWGLAWTKATFDESKVNRDAEGKFAEKAGAAGRLALAAAQKAQQGKMERQARQAAGWSVNNGPQPIPPSGLSTRPKQRRLGLWKS